ncbi:hypothetical protein QBC37DRAFT_86758 [Rhypophila decipiens]|uniref:Uncharacterized protein n=1 Tax=Rhypophila decipiens TaxID=261697 RepID=A0AAN6YI22_9PEZI|nr:hypothetical protein QBC37DRAFT_86758 [Rhypophila decipiens]
MGICSFRRCHQSYHDGVLWSFQTSFLVITLLTNLSGFLMAKFWAISFFIEQCFADSQSFCPASTSWVSQLLHLSRSVATPSGQIISTTMRSWQVLQSTTSSFACRAIASILLHWLDSGHSLRSRRAFNHFKLPVGSVLLGRQQPPSVSTLWAFKLLTGLMSIQLFSCLSAWSLESTTLLNPIVSDSSGQLCWADEHPTDIPILLVGLVSRVTMEQQFSPCLPLWAFRFETEPTGIQIFPISACWILATSMGAGGSRTN